MCRVDWTSDTRTCTISFFFRRVSRRPKRAPDVHRSAHSASTTREVRACDEGSHPPPPHYTKDVCFCQFPLSALRHSLKPLPSHQPPPQSLCGKRPKRSNYKQATTVHRTTGNPEIHEVTRCTCAQTHNHARSCTPSSNPSALIARAHDRFVFKE